MTETRRRYPFTLLYPGDKVFIKGEKIGGKAYSAAHAAASRTRRTFDITMCDEGLHVECMHVVEHVDRDEAFIRAMIDWRTGAFADDLVTATQAAETISDFSPHKIGRLFTRMGLTKLNANGKTLWAVRSPELYSDLKGSTLLRLHEKNPA